MMESDTVKELKRSIEKHTVRYEVWPHYEVVKDKRVVVGFDLEPYGTHDHGTTRLSPGCPRCQETYTDLRRLAESVLPKEKRPSMYDIPPFDASLRQSAKGVFEVAVAIRIEHRHAFFDPADLCEERCLKEMCERLAELGVSGGSHR